MNYEEIESLLKEAEAESKKGNHAETEHLCNLALEKIPHVPAQEAGKSVEDFKRIASLRAWSLRALSVSFWRRGMVKEAIPTAEEAVYLSIQAENKEQEANALNSLGNACRLLADYPRALEYYSKALVITEEIENKLGVASNTGNIGIVYAKLSDYPRALEYYAKSLAMNEEIGDKSGVAINTGNIGLVYQNLSDYPRALEYLSKALTINEEIGDKSGVASNTGNIGIVYAKLSDYPRALEYLSKALTINEEIGDKSGVAINTGNIGGVYAKLSDYPRALDYLSKALAIFEEIGNKLGIVQNITNIGLVYRNLSDYPRALDYLSKALAIFEEIGNKDGVAISFAYIGALYGTKEFEGYDADKAEDYLLKAIALYEEIGAKSFEAPQSLAKIYENEKRWEEAYENLKKSIELKDEVQSEEAKKQAELMEQRRQAAEQEKEIKIAKATAAAQLNATSTLLHRVLPESISTRMLEGEENISDFFPSVSILFADIQGFTAISANMKAIDVVRFLNFVFGEFDRIMKAHGCEKIKTIGDGYMAVAGAPIECEDHAERLAAAALEMQETIHLPEDIRSTMPEGSRFGIRIGLHTGSVVAGVIGQERFVYDIHSDAVNLASRMESSGEVDRVHVSSDFVEHLQARYNLTKNMKSRILFEDRGEMNIKGKGMMKTYFLENQQTRTD